LSHAPSHCSNSGAACVGEAPFSRPSPTTANGRDREFAAAPSSDRSVCAQLDGQWVDRRDQQVALIPVGSRNQLVRAHRASTVLRAT
jgi:hypothetical protein